MHCLQEILKVETPFCKMTSVVLIDVYYSVSVDESFQKYFKFYWKEKLNRFCVLLMAFCHSHTV